ncbi:phenylacetate--CoA ligase family protein [Streptomyces varsoviensis]|uniref:phenylacetate--CoA ligase family protein n=1 Tax=Streptomyces varsoviensis TaxID=67373 RepID=UPI000662212C|nr:phenylacetate--CoA ligase family protein [Streptomyces varsoviensis]
MKDPQIAELIRFVRERSPFYRELYAGQPDDAAELAALPLVPMREYWAAHGLRDSRVLTGPHTDGVVFNTGGTTSAPRISVYTWDEWRSAGRRFGEALVAAGLRQGDRVANLFYAGRLYPSFVFLYDCVQDLPVRTVQLPISGNAPLDFTVGVMRDFAATVVAAPPTSLCRLATEVVGSVGALPDVRLVLFGGEACYEDQLALIARAFPGAEVRSGGYGSVDAGGLGGPVPGEPDTRVHETFPDKVLELLDPDTGEVVEEPGRPGRVVVTDLTRRLMPLLRYPVGDLAEWVDFPRRRFRLLGRSGEEAKVGTVNVDLEGLHRLVESADDAGRAVGMQAVVRHREGLDELVLRLAGSAAPAADADAAGRADLERALTARVHVEDFAETLELGLIHPLAIEWVGPDGLVSNPRTGKRLRLVDERVG